LLNPETIVHIVDSSRPQKLIEPADWAVKVYKAEIVLNWEKLYRKRDTRCDKGGFVGELVFPIEGWHWHSDAKNRLRNGAPAAHFERNETQGI
jgi:hypothetical protein